MANGNLKDLSRRTSSDKILRDKAFDIGKLPKYDWSQRGLASIVYKFFDKKISGTRANKFSGSGIKNENISNKEIAEELHKPVVKNFLKRQVYSSFIDNIWVADLGNM